MKTKISLFLCLALASLGRAATWVEAPVTVAATVTRENARVDTATAVTLTTTAYKVGNREILLECVGRRLIPSITGWAIVCAYDAEMDGLYPSSEPIFRLRHKTLGTVALDSLLRVEALGGTGSGKASVGRTGAVSGTLKREAFYYLRMDYQGDTAVCYGLGTLPLAIKGTVDGYTGISGAATWTMQGTMDYSYEALVALKLSIGAFKRL